MSNFEFLQTQKQYNLFAAAAIEAERVYATAPAMCAVGVRKALELAVKWVYSADNTIEKPYSDNLQSLIHEPTFRFALVPEIWRTLPFVIKLGNLAVHTEKNVSSSDALYSLKCLFNFVEWIDYCYGKNYEERKFDENLVPKGKVTIDKKKIKEQENLLYEKNTEIESLRKQIEKISEELTNSKEKNKNERKLNVEDLSEFKTRKIYIDVELKELGWRLDGATQNVIEEYPVENMMGKLGQNGFADYVLMGKDGCPLAVIEAKRTSKDPNIGRKQAVLYADCLERKFGRRPMIFNTNGFETYFWDDTDSPQRKVGGLFSRDDLQRLMNRRSNRKALNEIKISDKITDRYYQKEAIRAVCDNIEQHFRKHLLVMATGTGKTRTASSLADVLTRGNYVTNILFLADRVALVKQAKDDFKNYLPNMSLCNLCSNKDSRDARIVFSTYPTILNEIDSCKSKTGVKFFSPAHFDLIIIDESHRSIFNKYKAIFEYFDAYMVGLTATPKTEIDRNTYDFFEMQNGVPTYAYDYETAVEKDHVLVPYYNYEVQTKFIENGIDYDDLSEEDKARYEDDFTLEDGDLPKFIPSNELNKFVFNEKTIDIVIQDLMERGIKVEGGDLLGKTIIFAQNKNHAEAILVRFNQLYPQLKGKFAQRIICDDAYAQTIIDEFKKPESELRIAVSVDMMDTGIDVPDCVNLVFFKKVRSKTKFWQMIGRGTRLCPSITCIDQIDGEYTGKRRFLIFDYCGNFKFFRTQPQGYESTEQKTLTENIFCKKIDIAIALQESTFAEEKYQSWREELADTCHAQICALNTSLVSVKLNLRYVEKFKNKKFFEFISEENRGELVKYIAPLVYSEDKDEFAKRFDNFIYSLILAKLTGKSTITQYKSKLCSIAKALEKRVSIPQIREKLDFIREIKTDEYWQSSDIFAFERTRVELRELIKFLVDVNTKKIIVTCLDDPIEEKSEGDRLAAAYDFEEYGKKVNRYIEEHKNMICIHKLTHNEKLTHAEYKELERILTVELGTKEDYRKQFGDTEFGLLIRKIAKLDYDAAMKEFSTFINSQSLNQKQINFIDKVINHLVANGYMEDVNALKKPPFDRPEDVIRLFPGKQLTELIDVINKFKENAINTVA